MSATTPLVARKSPFRRRALTDRQLAVALVVPTAIMLIGFQLYPFLVAAHDSLFQTNPYTGSQSWYGLQNFAAVVQSPDVQQAFGRTLVFVVGCMVIQTVAGLIIALLLNSRLRGQSIARGLTFFPYMVPAIVAAMAFRFGFNEVYGVVDYYLVSLHIVKVPVPFLSNINTVMLTIIIVTSWKFIPFMTIALLARLQTLPLDLVEAATVDGAGRWRVFQYVTLPWLMPVLLIAMLLRTIWLGTEFDTPYLVAFGGPLQASTLVSMQIRSLYIDQFQVGEASALALITAVLLTIGAITYLRAYRRVEALS
jgi:multiple sugar transport system permease protein